MRGSEEQGADKAGAVSGKMSFTEEVMFEQSEGVKEGRCRACTYPDGSFQVWPIREGTGIWSEPEQEGETLHL